ncbi:hypothetical protein Q8A73_003311 [Channa argus]|nr:hypothetical protein Q8A73_003311 [Channa argus]
MRISSVSLKVTLYACFPTLKCVTAETMLKVAFVLGCLLCLALANPIDDEASKRVERSSERFYYPGYSNYYPYYMYPNQQRNPLLYQYLLTLLLQPTTTTTPTTTPTTTTTTTTKSGKPGVLQKGQGSKLKNYGCHLVPSGVNREAMLKVVFVLGCLLCLTRANPMDEKVPKRLAPDESTVVPVFAYPAPAATCYSCSNYYTYNNHNYYHSFWKRGIPVLILSAHHHRSLTTIVKSDTMLKVVFVLGCLLCFALANPIDDKTSKRLGRRRRPNPPVNVDPDLTTAIIIIEDIQAVVSSAATAPTCSCHTSSSSTSHNPKSNSSPRPSDHKSTGRQQMS